MVFVITRGSPGRPIISSAIEDGKLGPIEKREIADATVVCPNDVDGTTILLPNLTSIEVCVADDAAKIWRHTHSSVSGVTVSRTPDRPDATGFKVNSSGL